MTAWRGDMAGTLSRAKKPVSAPATTTRRTTLAKLDLTFGTPVLGIIEKAMDIWLELYKAAPPEERADLARQIIQRSVVWEGFVNRILERMLDGKEE